MDDLEFGDLVVRNCESILGTLPEGHLGIFIRYQTAEETILPIRFVVLVKKPGFDEWSPWKCAPEFWDRYETS